MTSQNNVNMRQTTAFLVLPAIAVCCVLAGGCNDAEEPSSEDAAGAQAASPKAEANAEVAKGASRVSLAHNRDQTGIRKGRWGKKHCPSGKLIKIALKELDLSDEQRGTLEALRGDKDHKLDGHGGRGGPSGFHAILLSALETGKVDRDALAAKIEAKKGKIEQKLERCKTRLATLHKTLTPKQRGALVDAVRAKMDSKRDRTGKGHRDPHGKSMLHRLLRRLDLTPEQQAQIDELKAKSEQSGLSDEKLAAIRAEKKARFRALLIAFVADDFDPADVVSPEPPMKDHTGKVSARMDQIEALIGILTVEQRAELAGQVKERMERKGHGEGGHGCDGDCGGGCSKGE